MATITQETLIDLGGREALALGRLGGRVVECLRGEVWLTVDGEGQDTILGPGQQRLVESDNPVVVSAFAPSQLRIRKPARVPHGLASLLPALSEFSIP